MKLYILIYAFIALIISILFYSKLENNTWESSRSKDSLLSNFNITGKDGIRLYLGGSGDDMFSQKKTAEEVIQLSGKPHPTILYIGTCSYDAAKPKHLQTNQFIKLGCRVRNLDITYDNPGIERMQEELWNTDVILISGGNTLWGRDRWVKIGLDKLIKRAVMEWGKVWAGGSAGMILATDGGHSDSMDPSTFLTPPGPLMGHFISKKQIDTSWAYIRAPGLGIIKMIACPHYDKIESNGALRATSFDKMMKMHGGEYALVIDNWAGIIINGNSYKLVKRDGKSGSVTASGKYSSNPKIGKPGAWTISINPKNGETIRTIVPNSGHLSEISKPARFITQSQMLEPARKFNPQN
jgi:dipeptidase E